MRIWICQMLCGALMLPFLGLADHPPEDKPDGEKSEASDGVAAGHSNHGGAFNEGPRQAAYLMGNTGDIKFPITSKSSEAKEFFVQGMGQLHGFWYFEAERSFRQVALLDEGCAMAYWGMAQANIGNQTRARGFLKKAYENSEGITDREQQYINAFAAYLGIPVDAEARKKIKSMKTYKPKRSDKDRRGDYVRKLEDLSLSYPDDLEVKAQLLVQLWFNMRHGHAMNSTLAADGLAKQILEANPMHPVHHYRIHIWDRRKAEAALDSAAACGYAAPSIAHMWHMSGHIYSKVGRFADAAWHQEASARTDHRHMMKDRVLPDQIHNFAHNNEWLIRNMMHMGRVSDAVDLAINMTELPRHPKYNVLGKRGSATYGRQRLFQMLTSFELWEETIALEKTPALEPSELDKERLNRLRLLGRAYYGIGDLAAGDRIVAELGVLQKEIPVRQAEERAKKAKEEAEKKAKEAAEAVAKKGDKDKKPDKDKKSEGKVADAKGKKDQKAKKPKKSTEEKLAETIQFELELAKGLAEKRSKAVLTREGFKTNGIDGNLLTLAYLDAGDIKKAEELTAKGVSKQKTQVLQLARHILVLHAAGKTDEAKTYFNHLRVASEDCELDHPAFERLASIAKSFGFPEDWRLPRKAPTDIRKRPDLAYFGPIRWQPSKAVDWTLSDASGTQQSLAALNQDQDLLVIFYLGADCLHCVEQLNAFAPKVKDYEKAGIKIVAISLEDVKSLKASVSSYSDDGTFPFLLLSDKNLDVFKAYRAHDDFEDMPLHGTFLIDKQGMVRWQDISYEPFTKPDFLLKESQRLLAQPRKSVYGESIGQAQ